MSLRRQRFSGPWCKRKPHSDLLYKLHAVARLSQTLGAMTTNYGYGTGNDLLATISVGGIQTQSIGYSADGRMSTLSPGIQAPAGQYITSLTYNQDAQLSAVNAGGALASYTYDGFGQRLIKTVSGSNGEIYQFGQDGLLLEETNASGSALADYIYLDGRPVAVLNNSSGALYYLHDDLLGTPQLATNSGQSVQWRAGYQPFGQASVSGTITENLRFPGQYFDVESGWNHNGFRDYVPALGRYLEPDPLGRLGSGNNLYAYVDDNPTNLVDPLGLCPVTSHITCAQLAAGSVPIEGDSSWNAGATNTAKMYFGWLYGFGNTSTDFGPDSPESQEMMSAYGLAANVNNFLSGGPSSNFQNFGLNGLISSGTNPTAQFVGSYGWSMALSDGYLNITLTNSTTPYSFFLHAPFLNPNPPIRPSSGWHPMGHVNQIFHIRVKCGD